MFIAVIVMYFPLCAVLLQSGVRLGLRNVVKSDCCFDESCAPHTEDENYLQIEMHWFNIELIKY